MLARIGALRHAYALAVVMVGWVLFRCETFTQALRYYAALAGQGAAMRRGTRSPSTWTRWSRWRWRSPSSAPPPLGGGSANWRDARAAAGGAAGRLVLAADVAWLALVGVVACAWLAAGTYNPFIYFRF